jgi:hypothetical protein
MTRVLASTPHRDLVAISKGNVSTTFQVPGMNSMQQYASRGIIILFLDYVFIDMKLLSQAKKLAMCTFIATTILHRRTQPPTSGAQLYLLTATGNREAPSAVF